MGIHLPYIGYVLISDDPRKKKKNEEALSSIQTFMNFMKNVARDKALNKAFKPFTGRMLVSKDFDEILCETDADRRPKLRDFAADTKKRSLIVASMGHLFHERNNTVEAFVNNALGCFIPIINVSDDVHPLSPGILNHAAIARNTQRTGGRGGLDSHYELPFMLMNNQSHVQTRIRGRLTSLPDI